MIVMKRQDILQLEITRPEDCGCRMRSRSVSLCKPQLHSVLNTCWEICCSRVVGFGTSQLPVCRISAFGYARRQKLPLAPFLGFSALLFFFSLSLSLPLFLSFLFCFSLALSFFSDFSFLSLSLFPSLFCLGRCHSKLDPEGAACAPCAP